MIDTIDTIDTTVTYPIAFAMEYCDFSNPNHVWLMKGISRSKDNQKGYARFFRRAVITCPEDIEESYSEIRQLACKTGTVYRIYLSLNSRDVVKANFNYVKRLMDITAGVQQGLADQLAKSKKLGSEWKTELEQRRNRGTKRILIDVDDPSLIDEVVDFVENELPTEKIHAYRKTPNGFAISVEACDTRGLMSKFKGKDIDIQRDSMIFLERFQNAL